jgi:hypothetical protein
LIGENVFATALENTTFLYILEYCTGKRF